MKSIVLVLVLGLASGAIHAQDKSSQTLYERLGRYDGIATIADAFLKGVRADPQFARFSGRGADSLVRARQLLKEQLCALTGGPCVYIGRDMKTAHGGLAITESDWAISMKHMAAAVEKGRISDIDRNELLTLLGSLKPQIVEKDATKH